ncbi:uncharacterized protein LOC141785881 [Halichoeres trimaculatus]|uniref:uncharacterized protein LOC141785881 n=1 Tax=Halichoeres trimaculatus TaxID=147232 RepID=UPI003D9EF7BA
MDPDAEEADVFLDSEEPSIMKEEEEEEEEEESGEEESGEEEEDAKIFNAWMQRYRRGSQPGKAEEGDREVEGARSDSRNSLEPVVRRRTDRRASLPCASTLSSMQLSRLHSSTQAPMTARALLCRTSSRRFVPSPQEVAAPALSERRPSLIPPTIPEVTMPERRSAFRRRNVMSLSDAYSVCLICHNDLNKGNGGTRELQCTHTFHKECIEEWFWRKQSCPTCHVQVTIPQPMYWNSTRVKVP